MYFYFASRGKSTAGTLLPLTNGILLKEKQFQLFFCLMKRNRHKLLTFPKFNNAVSVLPPQAKAPSGVILPLGKPNYLTFGYTWISLWSLSSDLKS